MQVKPERLAQHLARHGRQACYLVFGAEPLQVVESVDAIRESAKAGGESERLVFDASTGADWSELSGLTSTLSLFATQRLIEIRLGSKKIDKNGAENLVTLVNAIDPSDTILISAGALDRTQQAAAWFKTCDQHGIVIQCRELDRNEFKNWLTQRCVSLELQLDEDAREFLSDRTEGNLLAAAQELAKLRLVTTSPTLGLTEVMAAIADSARYDVYQCVDAALAGEPARVVRIVRGLREEGTEPLILGWTLHRELRTLTRISAAVACGTPVDAALGEQNVWSSRHSLVKRALQRHRLAKLTMMLEASSRIDQLIKGYGLGDVWDELESLMLGLAGATWLGQAA